MSDLIIADGKHYSFECPHCGEPLEYLSDSYEYKSFKYCPCCGRGMYINGYITWEAIKEDQIQTRPDGGNLQEERGE